MHVNRIQAAHCGIAECLQAQVYSRGLIPSASSRSPLLYLNLERGRRDLAISASPDTARTADLDENALEDEVRSVTIV
jgi:hypothetical protein